MIDPDAPNQALNDEVARMFGDAATRIKAEVLNPSGSTDKARAFNQARAAQVGNQVNDIIIKLKRQSADLTGKAISEAMTKGISTGNKQLLDAGVLPKGGPLQGNFHLVDPRPIELLARDTIRDLTGAADSMKFVAESALRGMAATSVSTQEVNRLIAGSIIEGKPLAAQKQLRALLEKVHGKTVTITTGNGGEMNFDTKYYAELVVHSKTREAVLKSRHGRLQEKGIDLVRITGDRTRYPCTMLLGRIFSLSGRDDKYPALSTVSEGQLPYRLFHPWCSKSTVPYIAALQLPEESPQAEAEAA